MKYTTATWALRARILKILIRAYMKYCQFILQTDYRLLAATNTAYLVHIWLGSGAIENYLENMWKCATMSGRIWQTGLLNKEQFAAEKCGP